MCWATHRKMPVPRHLSQPVASRTVGAQPLLGTRKPAFHLLCSLCNERTQLASQDTSLPTCRLQRVGFSPGSPFTKLSLFSGGGCPRTRSVDQVASGSQRSTCVCHHTQLRVHFSVKRCVLVGEDLCSVGAGPTEAGRQHRIPLEVELQEVVSHRHRLQPHP